MSCKQLSDVVITFKGASHIPIGHWMTHSSDPYLYARLTPRARPSPEHPPFPLTLRTSTLRHTRDPEWNENWQLGGMPPEGFDLEVGVMDEYKPGDFDDRLGIAYLSITQLPLGGQDGGAGKPMEYILKIKKRKASRKAYIATYLVAWCHRDFTKQRGRLTLSIQNLRKSTCTRNCPYVLGPMRWSVHVSPMIGRLTHTRPPPGDEDGYLNAKIRRQIKKAGKAKEAAHSEQKKTHIPYLFEANKIQLLGAIPADLRNNYVDYRPYIGWMFTGRGIRGWLLQRGLHAQHRRIYSYNSKTTFGHVPTPSAVANEEVGNAKKFVPVHVSSEDDVDEFAASRQFLKMVHYDEAPGANVPGGRLYTYVITLQGEWRFTETGPEFAIQFLSKHSMHSDVAPEIAVAGEFFVRRRRRKGGMPLSHEHQEHEKENKEKTDDTDVDDLNTGAKRKFSYSSIQPPGAAEKKGMKEDSDEKDEKAKHDEAGSDPKEHKEKREQEDIGTNEGSEKHENQADTELIRVSHRPSHPIGRSRHPSNFVLIIDNDSGTYRPDKSQLPSLKKYLERNLPGLKIKVMACDDPKLKQWKEEQKPKKEVTKARHISQPSSNSESSSDSDSEE